MSRTTLIERNDKGYYTSMGTHEMEIIAGPNAVWVNNAACCLGRFGRLGIDIHHDLTGLSPDEVPNNQCLMCTHGPVTEEHWDEFVAAMERLHGVHVPGTFKPNWWCNGVHENA